MLQMQCSVHLPLGRLLIRSEFLVLGRSALSTRPLVGSCFSPEGFGVLVHCSVHLPFGRLLTLFRIFLCSGIMLCPPAPW